MCVFVFCICFLSAPVTTGESRDECGSIARGAAFKLPQLILRRVDYVSFKCMRENRNIDKLYLIKDLILSPGSPYFTWKILVRQLFMRRCCA